MFLFVFFLVKSPFCFISLDLTLWCFVYFRLRSTLCLQYKPHYIAAGSLFLAAKFHNVKLPSGRGYAWWNEFDVNPRQLEGDFLQFFGLQNWVDCNFTPWSLTDFQLMSLKSFNFYDLVPKVCLAWHFKLFHESSCHIHIIFRVHYQELNVGTKLWK